MYKKNNFFSFLGLISLFNLFISIISKGILDYSHEFGSELQIQAGALSSINGIIPFSYEKLIYVI